MGIPTYFSICISSLSSRRMYLIVGPDLAIVIGGWLYICLITSGLATGLMSCDWGSMLLHVEELPVSYFLRKKLDEGNS